MNTEFGVGALVAAVILVILLLLLLIWVSRRAYEMGWNDRDRGVCVGDKER